MPGPRAHFLPPYRELHARDVGDLGDALIGYGSCWPAGADTVPVGGAEGGTGWTPTSFLDHVGLPLAECLRRVRPGPECLLVSALGKYSPSALGAEDVWSLNGNWSPQDQTLMAE